MTNKHEETTIKLAKVVYFDEDSVTDYVQMVSGGVLEKTTELLKESNKGIDGKGEVKIGFSTVLAALMGIKASAAAEVDLDASFNTSKMAKNIVKNTILTDFIDIVGDRKCKGIEKFEDYNISAPKESLTYVALISPYLSMLKGGTGIPAGEFSIAIEKIENTLKNAKGYYEFLGENNVRQVIFRFNIKAFRNNYKASDLMKMDIAIYAIKVGRTALSNLNFNKEFDLEETVKVDNPSYTKEDIIPEENDNSVVDVYDVLLAGVEINDK